MDDNTWKMMQVFMWLMGIQTTIIIAVLGAFYTSLSRKIDATNLRIDKTNDRILKWSHH